MFYRFKNALLITCIAGLALTACSGGSEGTGGNPDPEILSGTVAAPGGAIAFNKLDLWQRMFASLFGSSAVAGITGVTNVGSGVSVNLVEVDAAGNQIGEVIGTDETDATGAYNIELPSNFNVGSQYVVRAIGSSENIDARVASTAVDVSPITDAASKLVTAQINDLGLVTTIELEEFVTTINALAKNVDPTGLSAQELSNAMQTEAAVNTGSSNVFASASSIGQICGTVTNASNAGVANVRIIARDYGDWVTRAKTTTASNGSYCLNVPKSGDIDSATGATFIGEYILGAINRKDDNVDFNRSATEWWTAGSNGYSQFEAEKITVADTTTVNKNFQLDDGAHISGSVQETGTGNPLEGIEVLVRTFESLAPVASVRSKEDGSYHVNVIAGTYSIETRNSTVQAFASETYDGANGSNNRNRGIPVTLVTGQTQTINFALNAGVKLDGVITDGVGGNAVTGHRVMVNLSSGGSAVRLRTNKIGSYRVWLSPDTYHIFAYGQQYYNFDLNVSQTVNFESTDVSSITAMVIHNGQPVSQAKVRVINAQGLFVNMEPSSSDGTVTVYTTSIGDHTIEARIDRRAEFGSIVYDGHTRLLSGTPVNVASFASTITLGDINLPTGGILTGIVTTNGIDPFPSFLVAVRDDDDLTGTSGGVTGEYNFIQKRTRGDGSYVLTLPAGVYDRVKMRDATVGGNDNGNCDAITIVEGQVTTVNYNDATDTCS